MRTLGGWILDQVFEAIGIIAEAKRRHHLNRQQP